MPVNIGSSGYNSKVTGTGSNKKTGSTGSAGSSGSAGSTLRGSVFGSFGSVGSAGSAGSLSDYQKQRDADRNAVNALRKAVLATPENKKYQEACSKFDKIYKELDKQRPWGTAQQNLYQQYYDARSVARSAVENTPAYKAFDDALDSYCDKYGSCDISPIFQIE